MADEPGRRELAACPASAGNGPPGDSGAHCASAIFVVLTAASMLGKISWVGPIPARCDLARRRTRFSEFLDVGRAAWLPDPSRFYDPHIYHDALTAFLGAGLSRPELVVSAEHHVIAAPFGRLTYFAALLFWTALGPGVLSLGCRAGASATAAAHPDSAFAGGFSADVGPELVSDRGDAADDRRLPRSPADPRRRLIGLLTLKPQLGLLFPVLLAASAAGACFCGGRRPRSSSCRTDGGRVRPQAWIDFVLKGISGPEYGAGRSGRSAHRSFRRSS